MRASSGVGSLPRPADPLAMDPADPAYRVRVRDPVANIVRRQTELGLDVVTDGEMNKPRSFITYVTDRLSGFEPSRESGAVPWADSKEAAPRFLCAGPVTQF